MLTHPLTALLDALRLQGMREAFQEQLQQSLGDLSFEERLSLLLEREKVYRENRRLATRLKQATLKQNAYLEDIDYRPSRGLEKMLLLSFHDCEWVKKHENILITGPCGTGKTYLACALAQRACLQEHSAKYFQITKFFHEATLAKSDGSYLKWLKRLLNFSVLIIDDFGLAVMNDTQRRDLLEIIDDRYLRTSLIVTSQLPFNAWHENIGDPTLADAILDRVMHNAHKLTLKGESMRKTGVEKTPKTEGKKEGKKSN